MNEPPQPYFALGAMDFGTKVDPKTSMELLDRYVERGGRWIDTANCYSFWADPSGVGGQSERVIGDWLASRPGVRDRVLISTKVRQQPTVPGEWPSSPRACRRPRSARRGTAGRRRCTVSYEPKLAAALSGATLRRLSHWRSASGRTGALLVPELTSARPAVMVIMEQSR